MDQGAGWVGVGEPAYLTQLAGLSSWQGFQPVDDGVGCLAELPAEGWAGEGCPPLVAGPGIVVAFGADAHVPGEHS
ncbi:hypothetical protein [Frankia sp. Cj5]|uniref:hypothetical protein n=1 Tax=Frankia sp. Cj5 TaxID=2880978 RepID=UPI001EF3FF76|nr:hypothetical protein [Frankia sp. Cj5]